MKRAITICLLTIFITACALTPVSEPRRPDPANEPTPVPTSAAIAKPTYEVERGEVVQSLQVNGRVVPSLEMPLSFAIAGTVAELLVLPGETAVEGELIARLDTTAFALDLELAEAELSVAQEQLDAAQNRFATQARLAEIALERAQIELALAQEVASETPTPTQTANIRLRELDVEEAQLALGDLTQVDPALVSAVVQAEQNVVDKQAQLELTNLYAPMSGQILSLDLAPGDAANPFQQIGVIADTSVIEVQVDLNDRAMTELSEGMAAEISFDDLPIPPLAMTIREMPAPYGQGNPDGDLGTRLSFDDPGQAAQLDLRTRVAVTIVVAVQEDVLWLPPAAIREFGGRRFVVVEDGSGQRRVDVRLGLANEQQVELVEGVAEGENVVGP